MLQVLPAARQHLDWQMVGTPLTHQHFRRRFQGAYGVKTPLDPFAASRGGSSSSGSSGGQGATGAAAVMQPQAVMAMKGLYCCGDNTFPYVGTPAVAASGMWVANTLAPVWKHWQAANVVDS
jgi:phytoene dehydrogenase-like protein